MTTGPLWRDMIARPRRTGADLTSSDVPDDPGVYAWFHAGRPIYVGVAAGGNGLRGRVWSNHLDQGLDLSRSSFRRNVCEHLGIASTSRTRLRPTVMTAGEVDQVNAWIRSCEVSWIVCQSPTEARDLETRMKSEWKPPLTKR